MTKKNDAIIPPLPPQKNKWHFWNISEKKKQKLEYLDTLSKLEVTTKIKLDEFRGGVPDISIWNKIRSRFSNKIWIMVILHFPNDLDTVKYYPMVKPYIVEINKKPYLFSPKSFRTMGKYQKLEFYIGIPFAILFNIKEEETYKPPSLDSYALKSVMQSKHIQDATTVKDINYDGLMIATIVLSALSFLIGCFNLYFLYNKFK